MKIFLRVFLALSIRLIYMLFSLLCIYRVRLNSTNKYYWLLMSLIGVLMIETAYIVWLRKGRDLKNSQLNTFVFMCCVMPIFWILCLDEAEKRANFKRIAENQEETIKQMFTSIHLNWLNNNTTNQTNNSNSKIIKNARAIPFECCDINLTYWIQYEHFELKLLFQIFLLIITLARCFTTRNSINLNQRILVFITTIMISVDMIEFLSYTTLETIFENTYLIYLILFIITSSLTQFIYLNIDLTTNCCQIDENDSLFRRKYNMIKNKLKTKPFNVSFVSFKQKKSFESIMSQKNECCFGCGLGNKFQQHHQQQQHKKIRIQKTNELFLIILSSMILHDLSYLTFRVFVCIRLGWYKMLVVDNSNMIFFMMKNIIMILIQLFKLNELSKFKKDENKKNLLINSRLEYLNNNNNMSKIKQNNPYRFAQVYASNDETNLDFVNNKQMNRGNNNNNNNRANLKSIQNLRFEYQQQQSATSQNRLLNPIEEYPFTYIKNNNSNNNHAKSFYAMSYANFTDKLSDNETNVSMLDA